MTITRRTSSRNASGRHRRGSDAQRQDLSQLLAHAALVETEVARLLVVARNQAPQLVLDHQRHRHGGNRPHVPHVLDVDRRHARRAANEVGGLAGLRIFGRHQPGRLVVGILDQSDAVGQIQPPRLVRNVGGREALAVIGRIARVQRFGHHAGIVVLVEAVQEYPAHAGDFLDGAHRVLADRIDRVDMRQGLQETAHERVEQAEVGGAAALHRLELDQGGMVAAMGDDVEVAGLAHFDGADVDRLRQRAGIEQGASDEVGMLGADQVIKAVAKNGGHIASE